MDLLCCFSSNNSESISDCKSDRKNQIFTQSCRETLELGAGARTWCRCAVRGAARLERVIPYLEVKSRQQGSERLRRSLTLHATDCETESETEKGIENELENDPGNES